MLTRLPEHWGNWSPEAQWSHCWPTTPGRHKHWPDSGLHEFPYDPSSEQWQAVDRKQERNEQWVHRSATGVKTVSGKKHHERPQVVSRIGFPIGYFSHHGSLEGRSLHVSHAATSWEESRIHHWGCQRGDLTRGCGRISDVRSEESWEEAGGEPFTKPAAMRFSCKQRTRWVYLSHQCATHQRSRDIRSGQVHSCRTRRLRSWENIYTGRWSCTQRRPHRRHRRCTLERGKQKYYEFATRAREAYL